MSSTISTAEARVRAVLVHNTPVGRLTLAASDRGLTKARFGSVRDTIGTGATGSAARAWLDLTRAELDAYFAGDLRQFSVPLDLHRVSEAHRRVLDALGDVGYGQTTTYGALAARLGLIDDGPRQVGVAMARNPIMIVIPCHRVLGAGGALTGYAGGLPAKRALLDLESRNAAAPPVPTNGTFGQ
jgi:methylated-DNA-[protein]-cysteine S-methyltransferase